MSVTLDSEAESIIRDVRTAFRDVQRGPLSLHQAMIAEYGTVDQLADAAHLDTDQAWDQIPDEYLEAGGKAFYYSDPVSWRYFIPAFIVWSLRYFRVNQSFVSDQTIYALDLPDCDQVLRSAALERFATLSLSQNKVVCRFLRYMARNEDFADAFVAKHALAERWDQFCEADIA